jgi:hypothetical protein
MSHRSRLASLLLTSTLLAAACVADLSDGPDSGASGGSGGSGLGLGGNRGGAGTNGGTTGAGGARTTGGGGSGVGGGGGTGGATTGGGGRAGGGGSGLGGSGVGGRGAGGAGLGGSGVGGRGVGGSGVGGSGVGGAVATACTNIGPSANGNGEYTFYSFGQGTSAAQEGGGFRTACGYFGTEAGGNATADTVQNIVNPQYFAAIPGTDPTHFNSSAQCGACIQVTYNGRSLIGTIIDECPQNLNSVCQRNPTGELDLSVPLAIALGFGPGSGQNGNPNGQTWKVVPCPAVGNVKVRVKTQNPNEVFIENTILAIKSVTVNGAQATRSFYGTWQLPVTAAAGQTLTLTDAGGRSITITVTGAGANVNQDTGKQFPSCQ